jgi:hypothetical protein
MLNLNYVNILLYGVDYGEDVNSAAVEWNQKMYTVVEDALAQNTAENVRFYISPGCNHTILGNPKLYTEETNGYTVAGWISQMLDTGLSGLDSVACSDCDVKPDYPSMWESCD